MTHNSSRNKVPLLATSIVAVAVTAMVTLGCWQLFIRWPDKLAKLHALEQAAAAAPIAYPQSGAQAENAHNLVLHHVVGECASVIKITLVSGGNDKGLPGWRVLALCKQAVPDEVLMAVDLGWSDTQKPIAWQGGKVSGVLVTNEENEPELILAPPLAGLEQSHLPHIEDVPNNHLAYAAQWFFFAGLAVVYYILALRKKRQEQE
jgi:surfeit locus 1 family protein